jgi:hypothetical protein
LGNDRKQRLLALLRFFGTPEALALMAQYEDSPA